MHAFRRQMLVTAAAALGAGALGCARRRPSGPSPVPFADADTLARGARALSEQAEPGLLALGVTDLAGPRVWCSDNTGQYPMAGLARLPIAAAALALVDAGKARLNERVRIAADELGPPPSRVNGLFPDAGEGRSAELPLADLVALAIQRQDSTAGDAVMRRAGGPAAVTAWLRSQGIEGVRVDRYEREVAQQAFGLEGARVDWRGERGFETALDNVAAARRQETMEAYLADPRDSATIRGVLSLLVALAAGSLLSSDSTRFLLGLMSSRAGGERGLAVGLPRGAALASVAGAMRTVLGFTPADNEAAVATLAGGRRLAMVAFIAGSTATADARGALMAQAARLLARAQP
jgi:beta-lactamase class A